jgi:hypothetical protein
LKVSIIHNLKDDGSIKNCKTFACTDTTLKWVENLGTLQTTIPAAWTAPKVFIWIWSPGGEVFKTLNGSGTRHNTSTNLLKVWI